MLGNLYTTKMSANKKTLQNRFTKITAAQLVGGNAYIPLRTVAELLGYTVVYVPLSSV